MKPIPPSEQWLHDNPAALASVKQGLADSAAGRVAPRVSTDYDTAFEEGRCAVERDRPLYAPRNPYPEDTQAHLGWHEGADEGGIMRDYTNGVRSDGQARKP